MSLNASKENYSSSPCTCKQPLLWDLGGRMHFASGVWAAKSCSFGGLRSYPWRSIPTAVKDRSGVAARAHASTHACGSFTMFVCRWCKCPGAVSSQQPALLRPKEYCRPRYPSNIAYWHIIFFLSKVLIVAKISFVTSLFKCVVESRCLCDFIVTCPLKKSMSRLSFNI